MSIPQATDFSDENQPTMIRSLKLGHESEIEDNSMATSAKILNIVYKFRLTKAADAHDKWIEGTPKFLNIIDNFVKMDMPIRMCMPAFPFKSANKVYKVLGSLPDRAEEAALEYMSTMCAEIGNIYSPGAKLLIVSDGLVYNDLLTIPDKDVWAYGQALRAMAAKRFPHIEFSRLRQLVTIDLPEKLDEVTYVANATNFRRALLSQFGKDDLDVHKLIEENEDTRLTYCGHSRFLFNDLRYIFPLERVARQQPAFAAAIKRNFPSHLRLSIHQSTGEHKISLSLLPTSTTFTTPWMCAVAYTAGGTLLSAPKGDFESDPKYQLVHRDGRPDFFVERSGSATVLAEVGMNEPNKANGAMTKGDQGSGKKPCPHCGMTTHSEARCFNKFPHLAPKRLQERLASSTCTNVIMATLNTEGVGTEAMMTSV